MSAVAEALRLVAIAELAGAAAWTTSDPTTYYGTNAQINRATANHLLERGLVEPDYRIVFREQLVMTADGWLEFLASTHIDTTRLVQAIRRSVFGKQADA